MNTIEGGVRMLDRNDLQAIAELMQQQKEELSELMDKKLEAQKAELVALIKEESRAATSRAIAYSEGAIEPKLDAIKEGLDLALETHIPKERMERAEEDIIVLKAVVRQHSEDIELLKKAQ